MKAKFGIVVVDGRGKSNGNVYAKNRAGNYIRTKVTPVNPRTAAQLGQRSSVTSLSQAWRGLDEAERAAWNAAVTNFQKTDIFGDLRKPSGFNLYMRLNLNLLAISEAVIDTPPVPSAVDDIVIGALTAGTTPTLSLAYTAAGSDSSTIIIRATPPVSPGKSFVKSEFRQISTFVGNVASPANILSAYQAKFGSIEGSGGMKIFVETVAIDTATGISGTPQQAVAIVLT